MEIEFDLSKDALNMDIPMIDEGADFTAPVIPECYPVKLGTSLIGNLFDSARFLLGACRNDGGACRDDE